jgi:ubiquinone biosynthesis protein
VVREWIERNLGPVGRIEGAVGGVSDLGKIVSGLPGIAARGVALLERSEVITRNGLLLAPETVEAIGRAEGRQSRWLTAGIWAIAVALAAAVWVLRN